MKLKKNRKSAEQQADENANVVRKKSGDERVVKKGRMPDHSEKHLDANTVGMSIGATINMENYESMRVDCWACVDVEDGESMEDALDRVRGVLDKKMQETVALYTDGD